MKLENAIKVLQKANAVGTFEAHVPSKNKAFMFSFPTIGQQKSISKVLIEEDIVKKHAIRLATIAACSQDPQFDIESLTDVDYMSLLVAFRLNTFSHPLTLKLRCLNLVEEKVNKDGVEKTIEKPCNHTILVNVDMNSILSKTFAYKFKSVEFSKRIKDTDYKFVLKDPNIFDFIGYQSFIESIKTNSDETSADTETLKNLAFFNYPIQFVSAIFINNEPIEDYQTTKFVDKIKFFGEQIPPEIIFTLDDDKNLINTINREFPKDRINSLFQEIVCAKCKDKKEGVITFDSFFII